MTNEEILSKKRKGDIILVAEIMGIGYDNARMILQRPMSKKHQSAIDTLKTVIELRDTVVEQAKSLQTK